jgi:hypothetical protein
MHVERGAFVKPLLPWKNNKFYISVCVCVRVCARARVCMCVWVAGWVDARARGQVQVRERL